MRADKIPITPPLAKVEAKTTDPSLCGVRGTIDLRVTIIPLLVAKLGLNSSEETVNGLAANFHAGGTED